jgi:hypothetical protein
MTEISNRFFSPPPPLPSRRQFSHDIYDIT